ncbi:MAG: IS3 family transposase [Pseudonocardiaceae bacterium]
MCAQLGVVGQGYYRWLVEGPSERERTETIRQIRTELHADPGVRRVRAELVVRGVRIAGKRVWPLMKAAGLRGHHLRAWRKTTTAGQRPVDAPDLIGQDFTTDQPDPRWWGDITTVPTVEGWVYPATVIDLPLPQGARSCRGRSPAHQPDHRGSHRRAADPHTPERRHCPQRPRLPVHLTKFADFCVINGVRRSMGRHATGYDNAVCESFFATGKKELIHTRPWRDLTEVRQHSFLWIEGYCNRRRRHLTT